MLCTGVVFIVLLSMLVPFVFLLSLSNGYLSDQQPRPPSAASSRTIADRHHHNPITPSNYVPSKSVPPNPPQHPSGTFAHQQNFRTKPIDFALDLTQQPRPREVPAPPTAPLRFPPSKNNNARVVARNPQVNDKKKTAAEEIGNLCEVRYGSYCHWREENREVMKDAMVKKLKDQLFVARAYFPSVAKIPAQAKLSQELKQNIQVLEHIFSESSVDADLPARVEKVLEKVEVSIAKAKARTLDCNNVDKKLRQILDLTEDESNFHMRQSAFLYRLAVQTRPKSFHCLSMKLTVECFKTSSHDMDVPMSEKVSDPALYHYVMFSNNVLAASVAVNSTVAHARETGNLVFHVVTDKQNFFAMKLWFFNNTFGEATVQVLNIEDLNLGGYDKAASLSDYLPLEFRVSLDESTNSTASFFRTYYVSLFSPAHYLMPYIFPNLNKVVVLEDDVVAQRDLTPLWSLNMNGKVNGALQLCSVRLGQLTTYLGKRNVVKNSCAWMSGLNIIDLSRWRELDLTATYLKLGREVKNAAGPAEVIALGTNLLTFEDQIYALDGKWVLSGLGQDYGLDNQVIKEAAVLHYNGLMKPWLELGIPKYKQYWRRFLNRESQFLSDCNVNA